MEFYREFQSVSVMDTQFLIFYFLMIGEATNLTFEQHLIFYVIFLSNNREGPHVTSFIDLLNLQDGTAISIYEVVTGQLKKMHWMSLNQVALTIDEASSMMGHRTRLATRMGAKVLTLINVHCVMHRKVLTASDKTKFFHSFKCWIILATKIINRRNELNRLLKDVF